MKCAERLHSGLSNLNRYTAFNPVQALNDAGFDRPAHCKFLLELPNFYLVPNKLAISFPLPVQSSKILAAQIFPVVGQVYDFVPVIFTGYSWLGMLFHYSDSIERLGHLANGRRLIKLAFE